MMDPKKPNADLKSVMDQFSSLMRGINIPGVNMDEMLNVQRRNMEACAKAAQIAAEAASAVARRQIELMRMALSEATSLVQGFNPAERPDEMMARQAELAKRAFESSVTNARELAEMIGKSSEEAFQIVQKRLSESLDEIHRTALTPRK